MAFVVEPVVSGLIKGLFKILGSNQVWDFARKLTGVESELKELENKLTQIGNLLREAEDQQLTDQSVKEWLDDLQHWAYDAEDLLDDFAYEALRRKMKAQHQASSSKGFSCLPACFPSPLFAVQMVFKIKEINSRLEKLRQQISAERDFQELSGMATSKAVVEGPEETSSVPPGQVVYGRKEDEVEPVVSGLIKGLFKILGSNEVQDFARQLVGGIDSELEELENKLQMVENLLRNAEDKQLSDESLENWLDNLQQWVYDAEDILDELAYEALRHKLEAEHQASSSKGFSCVPAFFPSPLFAVQMRFKMKEINSRLEKLRQQRSAEREFQELSSVPPGQVVYGRKEDEVKLLKMVKSGANFQVIAVIGMGGIGKTTIARVVYNHKQLEDFKFEEKAWVCVSTNFDVLKISKALLEQFSSSVPVNLNEVQVKVKEAVNGKKFLIVLDDIWKVKYNQWEKLMSPFAAGAPGSTIIVTTRHTDVAQTIRCPHTYYLNFLSQNDCKSLFKKHAFGIGAAAVPNQITNSIYKRVVERCGGLPLAAKALGGLLRYKTSNTWEEILESKIWSASDESDHILPALKLSYYYLPSNLKRCFGYCAIFPQNYEFEEKELALLWIAEGIVQPSDKQLDEASWCFHELCLRSLFQQLSSPSSKYVMHDFVYDLAQLVFKEIAFRSEQNIVELSEKFEKVRHFTYKPDIYTKKNKFKALEKAKSLRTFMHVRHGFGGVINTSVIFDLLSKLKMLRVLSFEEYHIIYLSDSIRSMMHLRYLNLSKTWIRSLPKSTCRLFNLQTLLLKDCFYLMKLPSKMRYLTNLCHLDISGRNSLEEMPLGMKKLKNLQILSNFIVGNQGKDTNSNLKDLESLSFLRGELHISKLQNVADPNQIREQILSDKRNLKVLLLEWGYQVNLVKADVKMNILAQLKPPSNLKELTIRGYGGESFPSWLGDGLWLSNLVVLKLVECEKCTSLPSLEMLGSLKDLTIKEMASLKKIDFRTPFKSLEFLHFENLKEWEHWDNRRETKIFPKLRVLSIKKCPQLIEEVPNYLSSLEKFVVKNCPKLVVSFSNYPIYCKLEIDECEGMVYNDGSIDFKLLDSRNLTNIPKVKDKLKEGLQRIDFFKIVCNKEIMESWQSMENTNFLSNLISLEIRECKNLISIGRAMLPSSLKRLRIEYCGELIFLEDLSVCSLLEYLMIFWCDSLRYISSNGPLPKTLNQLHVQCCRALETLSHSTNKCLPNTLTSIDIYDCEKLESIGEFFGNSPCLQKITLEDCKNFKSLPSGLNLCHCLESVEITGCPKLLVRENVSTSPGQPLINDKGMRMGKFTSLKRLKIWELPQLKSISDLTILTSLEELHIGFLPQLESIPNLNNLKSLKVYTIAGLKPIPNLRGLTSLTEFKIWDCRELKSIQYLSNRTALENFRICECPRIKSIPSLTSLNSLTELSITKCARLKSIPHLSNHISHGRLVIEDCPNLKSIPNLGNFTDLSIEKCPKLKSLQTLPPSLQSLYIKDCPLLKKRWKSVDGKIFLKDCSNS